MKNFVYFQPNKKDLKDDYGDCAVRALCKVLDKTWIEVFDLLVEKARVSQCMPNGKEAYAGVLKDFGFVYHGVSNKKGTTRPLVKQFAKQTQAPAVARTAHHLTACVDGKFYDTWDSGDRSMYGYWIKE